MAHAWLDSLSEDWVSQPPSDTSISANAGHAAGNSINQNTNAPVDFRPSGSRMPQLSYPAKKPQTPTRDVSAALSERSINDINIPASRRVPSKLSQEIKAHQRGRFSSRSFSASTSDNSVVHNTVNHKALSASPTRNHGQTPEWKRRLVYGELSYGEQPDLFTSAAGTGLENIFKPPTATPKPTAEESSEEDETNFQHEATLPSSPPVYQRDPSTIEIHVDESGADDLPKLPERRAPTAMRYRRMDNSDGPSSNSGPDSTREPESWVEESAEGSMLRPSTRPEDEVDVRKVSGQTVLNEDFSPIPIARHDTEDGKATFAPVDVPPSELRKRLEKLRRGQMRLRAESDDAVDESGRFMDETDDYEKLGAFINVRRGGRSSDGSFRNRMLSSALNDTSELHPEESLQASTPKQFPTVRMEQWEGTGRNEFLTPSLPRAPRPSPAKREWPQGSAGSPLKLFQPHDTFTNKTLLRRLSQFEGQIVGDSPSVVRQPTDADASQIPSDDGGDARQPDVAGEEEEQLQGSKRKTSASVSHFGAGALDGYEFNKDISITSQSGSEETDEGSGYDQDGESGQRAPRAHIFNVAHDSSPLDAESIVFPRRRGKSISSSSSKRSSKPSTLSTQNPLQKTSLLVPSRDQVLSTPKRRDTGSDGKRPRTSPAKDPTPKRRRTLHKSDIAYAAVDQLSALESVQLTHQQMQSIIGKKRKDARHGDLQQPANPNVLAMRQILRPRTPTPSQRSSIQRDRAPSGDEEVADQQQSDPRPASTAPLPYPVGTPLETDRKPSIKTEDFINEANKIMAMIRSKAGLGSGLASVEESESEHLHQAPDEEDSFQESTREPFSRPPSREGRPPLPRVLTRQEDPEIVQRLKQYEEASDMGDMITSMRSMGLPQGTLHLSKEQGAQVEGSPSHISSALYFGEGEVISDPPGIRLSVAPNRGGHKSTENLGDGFLSTGSNGSSGHSTNRSIPTGSSRGSANRKTIPPESVEHLIPDQVGSMVLDRQRNIWIKRKQTGSVRSRQHFLFSEGSEDDPFADIPDLSVDMTQEMRNLRILNAQKAEEARIAEMEGNKAMDSPAVSPPKESIRAPISSPTTPRSILDQDTASINGSPSRIVDTSVREIQLEETVEHEIGIHEGRLATPKKRNLTITFSSPIASVIQEVVADDAMTSADDASFVDRSAGDISFGSSKRGRRKVSVKATGVKRTSRSRSGSRLPARQLSVRGETFVPRPVSRIEERDEDTDVKNVPHRVGSRNLEVSIVGENSVVHLNGDDHRRNSLSFVVTTPARPKDCLADSVDAGNVIAECVGNLSLSPLSDFTIHRPDQSLPLEVSYVVANHYLTTGDPSQRVMSMNTKNLVHRLAEVEPFEPYWEEMRELDIQEKQLESLHQLDQFCGTLVRLDASKNEIRNLSGIPSSVRQLRITHNHLSSLTSWAHLMNLQYVDISNNELTSLSAFQNLVHLRSLRADNNQLTSLDGIKYHDGLQILRARGNALQEVDFENSTLHRLTELDLRSNKIKRLDNLGQLIALNTLYIDGNELDSLSVGEKMPLPSLRYLSLSDNHLQTIDLKGLPHLRLLHADRNRITTLTGFSRARRLDSLSLREQSGDQPLDLSILSGAYEVRKLFLSGNLLSSFDPQVDFLNLQLLELANCGLAELPPDLGELMPNLRVVNLNFNALSDLTPLRYIPRLKRLLAAGNRLGDATQLIEVLSGFPHLQVADLRDNIVTQGFYAPIRVVVRGDEVDTATDTFALPDQDAAADARYSSRLDLETRMRRRVYECMFAENCEKLKVLDGLAVRKDIGELRDAVWIALAARGLVVAEDGSKIDISTCEKDTESGCWEGEDSFA